MSFSDSVKRKEKDKRRRTIWPVAVREVNRFVRQYLVKAARSSKLAIRPDLFRVDGILLGRLTFWMDGQTVTITPLPFADALPQTGGCVSIRSTNGVSYYLLWKGEEPFQEQWQIGPLNNRSQQTEIEQALPIDEGNLSGFVPLSENSLDEALDALFAPSDRTEQVRTAILMDSAAAEVYGGARQRVFGGRKSIEYTPGDRNNGRGTGHTMYKL